MEKLQKAQFELSNAGILRYFMSAHQRLTLMELIKSSEESLHFVHKVLEYADRVKNMPKTYEQDGKGKNAIVYLHYFGGSVDLWITEKDMGVIEGDTDVEQIQAFGVVNLYGTGIKEGELGYISIQEAIENGLELDLYWEPKAIKDIK